MVRHSLKLLGNSSAHFTCALMSIYHTVISDQRTWGLQDGFVENIRLLFCAEYSDTQCFHNCGGNPSIVEVAGCGCVVFCKPHNNAFYRSSVIDHGRSACIVQPSALENTNHCERILELIRTGLKISASFEMFKI